MKRVIRALLLMPLPILSTFGVSGAKAAPQEKTSRVSQTRQSRRTRPSANNSERKFSLDSISDVLWWLPEDTQTVFVVRGPFSVTASEPSEDIAPAEYVRLALEMLPLGILRTIKKGMGLNHLVGHRVLFCVEGSRKFRAPKSLGGMTFEGCSIIVFEQSLGRDRNAFISEIAKSAKRIRTISGHQVMSFEEKLEEDTWNLLVVMPAPNVLLCATNEDYLSQVFRRMNHKGERRALPDTLPEWSQVNTEAKFWALRHYDAADAKNDPTSPLTGTQFLGWPDKKAIGLVFDFDANGPGSARVRYLSRNVNALKLFSDEMTKAKSERGDLKPQIRQTESGVVEMKVSLNEREQVGMFLFVLLALLGRAIFV